MGWFKRKSLEERLQEIRDRFDDGRYRENLSSVWPPITQEAAVARRISRLCMELRSAAALALKKQREGKEWRPFARELEQAGSYAVEEAEAKGTSERQEQDDCTLSANAIGALVDIKIPDIGDFSDVEVIEVMVKPGDAVGVDDLLITIESDKASMDVPSTEAGVVKEIRVQVGDRVSEGSPIVVIETAVLADNISALVNVEDEAVSDDERQHATSGVAAVDAAEQTGLMAALNNMIGLDSVKRSLEEIRSLLAINVERQQASLPTSRLSLHAVFVGNPGTGKTTIARAYAQILRENGYLTKGHLVEADRSTLVAGYVGQTAEKTLKILKRSLGGVLFIDEAYSLKHDDQDWFGQECIDTLLKFMEDHRDDYSHNLGRLPRPSRCLAGNKSWIQEQVRGTSRLRGLLE